MNKNLEEISDGKAAMIVQAVPRAVRTWENPFC